LLDILCREGIKYRRSEDTYTEPFDGGFSPVSEDAEGREIFMRYRVSQRN
jgi:hypothetical protein